jgi:hypothetical protein
VVLRVNRDGPALRLVWDRNAEAIRGADHAKLYIEDGIHKSQLDLDSSELKIGTFSYWPETQDVKFRLEAISGQEVTAGAIRVVGGEPAPVEAPAPAAVPEPAPQPVPTPAPARAPVAVAQTKKPVRPALSSLAQREVVEDHKPSPFHPIPPPAKAVSPPADGEQAVSTLNEPVKQPEAPPVAPPPTRERDPYVFMSAEPLSGSFLGRVVHKIPLIRRLKKQPQGFTPPRPIRQVRPVLTSEELGRLNSSTPIQVKVYVTDSGKVDYAELLSRTSPGNRPLATASVYAARRWSFTPARVGEENVPGEVILHFEFRPPENESR